MEQAKIAILIAEISRQKEEIEKIYAKIKQRSANLKSKTQVESLAYHLHNLYCAYEDIFKIVSDAFENNIEEGITYHKELLRRMSVSIEGIRPRLITQEALSLLSELRAFRHFFRHAYTYELDTSKVKIVLEKALKLKDIFKKDLDNFITALKKIK